MADRIWMPFGIIGRTGPGMRQVVGFRDRSTVRGTFGANLGRAIVTNGDFTAYVCDSAATRPSSQITLGRLVLLFQFAVLQFAIDSLTDLCRCVVRTKWKRQTTAPMRAEQLRNHSCDEKDCPGARRLHQNASVLASSTPTSSEMVSSFCRHCDVMQGLTTGSTVVTGGSEDSLGGELQRRTSSTSLTAVSYTHLTLPTIYSV